MYKSQSCSAGGTEVCRFGSRQIFTVFTEAFTTATAIIFTSFHQLSTPSTASDLHHPPPQIYTIHRLRSTPSTASDLHHPPPQIYTMSRLLLGPAVLLLLLSVWVSLEEASPLKCCTNYSPNPFPLNRLKHFSVQDATGVCRLSAVIFTTLKNKKICADPEAAWVKDAVSHIKSKAKPTETQFGA